MEDWEEIGYFGFKFWNGFVVGFGVHKYPEFRRVDTVLYLPFMQFSWVRQLVSSDEAERFLDDGNPPTATNSK
jgi:hypothetical protein